MKSTLVLIPCLCLSSILYAQADSAPPSFFPHHLGDTWIYSVRNGVGIDLLQVTVVADSNDIVGNAYVRHKLKTRNPLSQYPWFEYYKIDTAGNVFVNCTDTNLASYDRLDYKADAQLWETWNPDSPNYYETARVNQVNKSVILGDTTTIKSIGYYPIGTPFTKVYADRLGMIYVGGPNLWYELTLRGAIIAENAYGDLTPVLTDTSIHADFFPHHLSDTWVYYVHNGVGDDTLQVTMITDSVDAKGNAYVQYAVGIRKSNVPPNDYWLYLNQMVDTPGNIYVKRFNTVQASFDRLQYKADASLGHSWSPDSAESYETVTLETISNLSVLGDTVMVKNISHYYGSPGAQKILIYTDGYADGFGLTFRGGADLGYEIYLMAATINGRKYGDTLLTSVRIPHNQQYAIFTQMYPNFPNPFNPSTTIRFSIPERSRVRVTIFNLLGQQVAELSNEEMNSGTFERVWNANVSSGLYFYRLEAISVSDPKKSFVAVKKMVLVK